MAAPAKKRVVVVGAGAFGLSTALYLQRYHQHNVDVLLLDSQPFPSVDSASGNDTSRAIRPDYADPFYAALAQEAIQAWRTDPVFSGHYRESGRVTAAPPGSPFAQKCRNVLKEIGVEVEEFGGEGKVSNLHKRFPLLGNDKKLDGWDFYLNPNAGWGNPREAVISAMKEFQSLGGKFIGDSQRGLVIENILEAQGGASQVIGVKTASGNSHYADQVIYTPGAFSTTNEKLLPGLDTQIHPTGFAIAHWKLDDPEELKTWLQYPVVDMYHHGYFFPPDPSTGLMKLGLGIVGFTHDPEAEEDRGNVGIALPNSSLVGTPNAARIPALAEDGIRHVLSLWAPSLAQKKFFDMKMCWDAMTPDGGWLIDHHPEIKGLSVATGGSGHGFKFLPVVGQYICEALDIAEPGTPSALAPKTSDQVKQMRHKWRWGREANLNVKDRRVVLQGRPILDITHHLQSDAPKSIDRWTRSKL